MILHTRLFHAMYCTRNEAVLFIYVAALGVPLYDAEELDQSYMSFVCENVVDYGAN
jgi:hypothetical protein